MGDKEPVAGGVWRGFECGAKMGNPKAGARRKRVAGSRKAVEEKRGSATGEADVEVRKEKAQRVGDGVLEKQAQGGAGRSARDERYAKRKARTEEGGGGDCGPTVKQAKGHAASTARGVRSALDPGD